MANSHQARHLVSLWLACCFAVPASAAEPLGWYVGAASENTDVEVNRGDGWQWAPARSGYSAFGGLRFGPHFAADLALRHTSNLEWSEYFTVDGFLLSDTVFDVRSLHASAVGILPFAERFELFAKGGLAYSWLDGRQRSMTSILSDSSTTRSVSSNGFGYLFGGGVGVTIAGSWHVSAEYDYFYFDESLIGTRDPATVDSVRFAVAYRFGKKSAAD